MLNFNLPESPTRPVWKLFVMDAAGQKILGPSIKVNDLREHGVTLFLQLKSQRERVPDVPAVYFVEPCPESVASICQVINYVLLCTLSYLLTLFLTSYLPPPTSS